MMRCADAARRRVHEPHAAETTDSHCFQRRLLLLLLLLLLQSPSTTSVAAFDR